jgi:hypothetical protein
MRQEKKEMGRRRRRRRRRKYTFLAVCLIPCVMSFSYAGVEDNMIHERDLREGKIIVTRPGSADPHVLCGRVMGIIDAPIDLVWMALSDYNHFHQFLPRLPVTFIVDKNVMVEINKKPQWNRQELESMLSRHRLHTLNSDTVYFYNVLDMPFPVGDRWYLLKMIREPEKYTVHWSIVTGNMVVNDGSWELTPCSDDPSHTLAVYTTCSDSGVNLPKFIINIGMKKSLPGIITGLRGRVHQMKKEWVKILSKMNL